MDAHEPNAVSAHPRGEEKGALQAWPEGMEKVKVLIVDDLPHKLTALSALLADDNLNLVQARSGADALRHLLREDFALILLDVHMPGLDGFETAALIRQRKRSEHTPIIFVTANNNSGTNLEKGYSLGAVDYIYTPVVPEVLRAKVAVFVELFRINRTVRQQAKALRSYNLDLELANRKLETRTLELQSSRESFRNIVEKNEEGLAVVDADGVIRFSNAAFAHMLGDPPEGMVGQPFPFARETGRTLEIDLSAGSRNAIPVELCVTETQWEGKSALLASLRDISMRRSAENALRESEENLRQAQKLESLGRLAGGVAHDFNNLLTAINGYTDLVLASREVGQPIRSHLEEVRRSGERAAELTHQLLAYSRKQVLIPKLLSLNSVVDNMTNMLRRLIGENVELLADLDPNLAMVKVDPGQLEHVIMNLVVNAKDAMSSGGRITVETGMERLEDGSEILQSMDKELSVTPGAYVVLCVSDTGTGMDEATKARIFEPFFTTKEVGKGTGLGLSMVYGFVKQSGGIITVAAHPGEGSVFRIFLPVASGTSVWRPGIGMEGSQEVRGVETILLVEDEGSVRKFLFNVLQQSGYRVLEAEDGRQALEKEEGFAETIHLLLTDVMMANMGGKELAKQLVKRRPGLKILFMSGYAEEAVSPNGGFPEESEFLQKPFSPGKLSQKVREVLDSGVVRGAGRP